MCALKTRRCVVRVHTSRPMKEAAVLPVNVQVLNMILLKNIYITVVTSEIMCIAFLQEHGDCPS